MPSSCQSYEPATLIELLQQRAGDEATTTGYTFLGDGENKEEHLSYGELARQARSIAALLQARGASGERVLLLYPPGLLYIAAFFGCLYAGAVAVPAYPPAQWREGRTIVRLRTIAHDAQARFALTTTTIAALMRSIQFKEAIERTPVIGKWLAALWSGGKGEAASDWLGGLELIATDRLDTACSDAWHMPKITGDTLAFLQYTSGSTGTPKGVILSHRHLLANLLLIAELFGHSRDSRGVIWLPPYHDMGLIGGILEPLYAGFPVVLMSPLAFLEKPYRWLAAISRYRATTSGGPNFAYELCVRKITAAQKEKLDLASWQVAFNGAEPIRAETLDKFGSSFASCGFRRTAWFPCYGLAEATLLVSGGPCSQGDVRFAADAGRLQRHEVAQAESEESSRTLVGCGQLPTGVEVAIVADGKSCPPGRVAEVWVRGPGIAHGYWQKTEASQETFAARLAAEPEKTYLRTGDLGFLRDGQLFICGRSKDLIIVRGHNHYPQDIEKTVEYSHAAIRPGCCAAFAINTPDGEGLTVVAESDFARTSPAATPEEVLAAVREAIAHCHELEAEAILLVKPHTMPKTSSGKLERYRCRDMFLAGSFDQETTIRWPKSSPRGSEQRTFAPKVRVSKTTDPRYEDLGQLIMRHGRELQNQVSDKAAPGFVALNHSELLQLPMPERIAYLALWLRHQLADTLHRDLSEITETQNLLALGMDSLALAEIKFRSEELLQNEVVPLAELFGYTVAQWAARAASQLATATPAATISAAPRQALEVLSCAQEGIWLFEKVQPGGFSYHIPAALRLCGRLDVAAVKRSFGLLAQRHETLRTVLVEQDGKAWQKILPDVGVVIPLWDMRALPAHERETIKARRLTEVLETPFDLARGPLWRVWLLQEGEEDYTLACVVHHLIADGWTMRLLLYDFAVSYRHVVSGAPLSWPELPFHYADFARWQRQVWEQEALPSEMSFWRDYLAGAPLMLELPGDRPRPALPTWRAGRCQTMLPKKLGERLKELGRSEEATLFMILLSALSVVLYRYTGQEEMVIGAPIAGRHRPRCEHVAGMFVNALALRSDLRGSPTFRELLRRVRAKTVSAYAHQDMPQERLVAELLPERDFSHTPLFQVMCNMLVTLPDLDEIADHMPGIAVSYDEMPEPGVKFDITLYAQEQKTGIALTLVYNRDLFLHDSMECLLGRFVTLLQNAAAEPEQKVSTISLLSAAEKARQEIYNVPRDPSVVKFSEADTQQTIANRFYREAMRYSERLAVKTENSPCTYRDLAEAAQRVAWQIDKQCGSGEGRVALLFEYDVAMLTAMLGALTCGKIYVPLDPLYPVERSRYILEDSEASAILTNNRNAALAQELCGGRLPVIVVDSEISGDAGRLTAAGVSPDTPAYILYTSGSTGKPKGVVQSQRNVLCHIRNYTNQLGIGADDRLTLLASYTFDAAVMDIFGALLNGAALYPFSIKEKGFVSLAHLLQNEKITIYHSTPTVYRHFLASLGEADACRFPHLRLVVMGGEEVTTNDVALYRRHFATDCVFVNGMGPTEATLALQYFLHHDTPLPRTVVPVGYAVPDTEVLLLNEKREVAEVYGEIAIRASQVSLGYWHQPELTAQVFLPDPQGGERRIYCSGDMGRLLPDGSIAFVGRKDFQVKIRGCRVELREIEAVLGGFAGVQEVAVVVRPEKAGEKSLVAYVVAHTQATLTPALLRDFAREKLPAYMVPAHFVLLPAMPLTPSGKVDRQALPAPPPSSEETAFVAPRNETERILAQIWQEILRIEKVGVHDNFFALGGDSLTAIQVLGKAKNAGLLLEPKLMFTCRSVAELAAAASPAVAQEERKAVTLPDDKAHYTPSDFPDACLSQQELDDLLGHFGGDDNG
jgi:amino acid adenylation domain-containing protein